MRRAAKHAGKYILLLIMLVCFGHILAMGTEIGSYGTPLESLYRSTAGICVYLRRFTKWTQIIHMQTCQKQ